MTNIALPSAEVEFDLEYIHVILSLHYKYKEKSVILQSIGNKRQGNKGGHLYLQIL